ncbi:hypothetical protein AVEN_170396-1, partial [Araneus ventricosus]
SDFSSLNFKVGVPPDYIREWKVLDQGTLSDHRLILTEVNFQKTGRTERRKILKLQDIKILDFKRDLKEIIKTFSEADITSENLEDYIDKFYEGLYLICEINQKKISENKGNGMLFKKELKRNKNFMNETNFIFLIS